MELRKRRQLLIVSIFFRIFLQLPILPYGFSSCLVITFARISQSYIITWLLLKLQHGTQLWKGRHIWESLPNPFVFQSGLVLYYALLFSNETSDSTSEGKG